MLNSILVRAPGKHFPGPDFPLLKMGKVNLFDKFYKFYMIWGPHFPHCFFLIKGKSWPKILEDPASSGLKVCGSGRVLVGSDYYV